MRRRLVGAHGGGGGGGGGGCVGLLLPAPEEDLQLAVVERLGLAPRDAVYFPGAHPVGPQAPFGRGLLGAADFDTLGHGKLCLLFVFFTMMFHVRQDKKKCKKKYFLHFIFIFVFVFV
jgi:hypothetical protein